MVMDPRFSECERAWHRVQKITSAASGGTPSYMETGVVIVSDDGTLATPRMMSLEQYSEIIGEGRYFLGVVRAAGKEAGEVKGWEEGDLLDLVRQECPNYFDKKGDPNEAAKILVKLLRADWLGLISDYCEVGNIDQWVLVESGDVAPRVDRADPDHPIAHAEVEYLDRALTYRSILRANAIKVLAKLGGPKLEEEFSKVTLTDFEKDAVMREVFSQKYDELYKALPAVLGILQTAQEQTFDHRLDVQTGLFKGYAQAAVSAIKRGDTKPLDLLDVEGSGDLESEAEKFRKVQGDENLRTLFYIDLQAQEMVKDYPGFQAVIDLVGPYLESAQPIPQPGFESLLEEVRVKAQEAVEDPSVGTRD
jgi:hypothetical protein